MYGVLIHTSSQCYKRVPVMDFLYGNNAITHEYVPTMDINIRCTVAGFMAVVCAYTDITKEEILRELNRLAPIGEIGDQKWEFMEDMEPHPCPGNCVGKQQKYHYYLL